MNAKRAQAAKLSVSSPLIVKPGTTKQ
jgi:hypothetical protein